MIFSDFSLGTSLLMSARLITNCSASARLLYSWLNSFNLLSWFWVGRYLIRVFSKFSVRTEVSHLRMLFLKSA